MGRRSTLTPAAFVDPEALVQFLDALRNVGYGISTEQYMAAQDLVLALAAQGAGAGDRERLRRMLGPLLCGTPGEQADFGPYFDRWADRLLPARSGGDDTSDGVESQAHVDPPVRDLATELDAIGRTSRRFLMIVRPLAVLLAIALGVGYFALRPSDGKLELRSTPDGAVVRYTRVDSVGVPDVSVLLACASTQDSVGVTPLTLQLPPGRYAVCLAAPDHRDTAVTFDVKPRSVVYQDVTLSPLGADTIIDGRTDSVVAPPVNVQTATATQVTPPVNPGVGPLVSPDTSGDQLTIISERPRFRWLIGALLALALPWMVYRLYLLQRATEFVRRHVTSGEQPHLDRLSLPAVGASLYPPREIQQIASRLRRRVELPSPELNVGRTVAETLRHGGVFTPAFRRLQVSPEYLALVDRTTLADQQAALIDELLATLRAEHVFITRYFFDGDPRVCFPADPRSKPVSLGALAQRHHGHRLLIFGDARRFFHPITGALEQWTDDLRHWPSRALLTPEPALRWGRSEGVLGQELAVQHASAAGIAAAVAGTREEAGSGADAAVHPAPFPPLLQQRPARWIERAPPTGPETERMLEQLQQYLEDSGMVWLAACAVYPALGWKLTLNLGHELVTNYGERVLQADRVLRLARLPWFRYGYIPDWLRLRLLSFLTPQQEQQVRHTLERLLLAAVVGRDGAADLVVAAQHDTTIHEMIRPILRVLQRRSSSPSDAVQDFVFARFMRGQSSERLTVRVSRVLPALRRAVADGRAIRGRRIRRGLVGLGVAASLFVLTGVVRSWRANSALAEQMASATRAVRALQQVTSEPGTIAFASAPALQILENLRGRLETLRTYSSHRPEELGWGMWRGDALLADGQRVWLEGYNTQLHLAAYSALVDSLRALPDAPRPTDDYGVDYGMLKAYLIMTSESPRSNADFLAPVLLRSWKRGQNIDADMEALARRQFEFYATLLWRENPWPEATDASIVSNARAFLNRFSGSERIYQSMLAKADESTSAAKLADAGSITSGVIDAPAEVAGAYTAAGWAFLQAAFRDADRYLEGEPWVVGDVTAALSQDREAIVSAVRARYSSDYINTWRVFVLSTKVVRPSGAREAGVKDAAQKLAVLSSARSPLLAVLAMVARNTNVDATVSAAFQPVHAVVPPDANGKYVNEGNQSYVNALVGLREALEQVSSMPPVVDSASAMAMVQKAQEVMGSVTQAKVAARQLAQKFAVDAAAAQIARALVALLEAPINGAEAVLRGVAAIRPP